MLTAVVPPLAEVSWGERLQLAADRLMAQADARATPDEWVIGVSDPANRAALADQFSGGQPLQPTGIIAGAYRLELPATGLLSAGHSASNVAKQLSQLPGVSFAFPLLQRQGTPRLVPNDALFPSQWHLHNTGQRGGLAGEDANLTAAWDTATGQGVVIGIVDDGLEHAHADLGGNYRADLSFDFNHSDADPTPDSSVDDHGTSVAGVAAALGNNTAGVSGAAFAAELAGLRLISAPVTDLLEATALSYHRDSIDIYNNSWGPEDDGERLEAPGPLTLAALEQSVAAGRGGLGSIYVWAGGNGGTEDNVNFDGYANSRFTIAVTAVDDRGRQADYSEAGAALLIAAPSDGGAAGITTTAINNGYLHDFGGTSSAAPLVSGAIALALEANPNLSWRDVQHLLVNTARQNDTLDADWTANGAGHAINHKYGFGVIDAAALVSAAGGWTAVGPELSLSSGSISVGQPIPDDDAIGVSSTFTVDQNIRLESVEVTLDAGHPYRGDLEIVLTSPEGTESVLAQQHGDPSQDYPHWTFSSVRHWDELSLGEWTLTVRDLASSDEGTFNSWQLDLHGTAAGEFVPDLHDFAPRPPLGSLVYQQELVASIGEAGEIDTFEINLTAGNTLSLAVDPEGSLAPQVVVRNPAGVPVASSSASAGQAVVIQTLPLAASGVYEVSIAGAGAATGGYSLDVLLNALHEEEAFGGPDNVSTPQWLGGAASFAEADRQAVAGQLFTNGDFDWYRFEAAPGESFTLAASAADQPGGFSIELYDDASTLLARGEATADNADQRIDDFLNTSPAAPTTYSVRIVPAGTRPNVDYTLLLTRNMAFDREPNNNRWEQAQGPLPPSGKALGHTGPQALQLAEQEPNDDGIRGGGPGDLPLANNLQPGFRLSGAETYQARSEGTIVEGNDLDWDFYRFVAGPGDRLTAALTGLSLGDPYLRLYDREGIEIEEDDDGGPGLDSLIDFDQFGYAGEYYLAADSYGGSSGSYRLDVTLETSNFHSEAIDYYQVALQANQPLTVTATAPSGGPGQFENLLQPRVELHDAAGNLVAGGNGGLAHTSLAGGPHTLRISDAEQLAAGEYLLTVTGAAASPSPSPPAVVSVTPAAGSSLGSVPTQIVLELDQPLRLNTIEAGDLRIDGQPALSVSVVDAHTLAFDPGALAGGSHTLELPAGAVTSWRGAANLLFEAGFAIDMTGPRIIGSSLQQNDRLAEGPLTVTLRFDEPLDQSQLDAGDVSLAGSHYPARPADALSYNAALHTVTLTFNDLLDDLYRLTVDSSATGFQDRAGNLLDGEPLAFPIGPAATGDGSPGGDFLVDLEVDLDIRTSHGFERLAPLGSLIARNTASFGVLARADDVDHFALNLPAGQTIVVRATPADPQAILTLELGTIALSQTAPAPGAPVQLPLAALMATGSIEAQLSSDRITSYTLEMVLNAAVEWGASDSGAAAPLAFDASRLSLSGNRYAAVGELPAAAPQSTDTYTLDLTGQAGTALDIVFAALDPAALADATVELLAPGGSVLATAAADPLGIPVTNFDQALLGYVLPAEGLYAIRVTGGAQGGRYSLLVTSSLAFEAEPNDSAGDPLRELGIGQTALGLLGPLPPSLNSQGLAPPVDPPAKPSAAKHLHDHPHGRLVLPPSVQLVSRDGFLSPPSADDPLLIARRFLTAHAAEFGLTAEGVEQLQLTDRYASAGSGTTHLYFRQTHEGLPVLNAALSVNVTAAGQVINAGGGAVAGLSTSISQRFVSPALSASEAVAALADHFQWDAVGTIREAAIAATKDYRTTLWASSLARNAIPMSLAYVPAAGGGVELAWSMNVELQAGSHWYDAAVSAVTGETLYWSDWASHAAYNVFPLPLESPNFGERQLEVDPHNPLASPQAWHDTDGNPGAEFTITRGNNVSAYADRNDDNQPDPGSQPDGGPALTFDFPLDETQNPSTYQPAAVTNLFYWNNVIHDVLYQYGFDEAAGNFQFNNYGRGGAQGDHVLAEAQDGAENGKADNANFLTPPDGSSPRMQMYLFGSESRDGDLDNGIITHEYGHGVSNRLTGGPSNASALNATQSGGMGEGWSDWLALMFSQQEGDAANDARGMGTYALGEPAGGSGIRTQRYSYDMSVNDLTYARVATQAVPHGLGEIWCSTLWDLNWLLIEGSSLDSRLPAGLGFDADLYEGTGGNNVALQLVLDGMKLQPANPSFLDARDALLAADQAAFDGAYQTHIRLAFARRGMGFSADDGGSANSTSVTEAFDLPATSLGSIELDQEFYAEGDLVQVTLRDIDLSSEAAPVVTLTSSGGDTELLTLVSQELGVFTGTIPLAGGAAAADGLLQALANQQIAVSYLDADDGSGSPATPSDSAYLLTVVELVDFDFSDSFGNPFAEGFTSGGSNNQWHLSAGRGFDAGHSADDSFYFGSNESASGGGEYANDASGTLTSPLLDLRAAAAPLTLSFNHFLQAEEDFDEAEVAVLVGENRTPLLSHRTGTLPTETGGFVTQTVDLSAFAGEQIRLEFLFTSDVSVTYEGWYLDDIRLSSIAYDPNLRGPSVVSVDPPEGTSQSTAIDTIAIEFDEPLDPASAQQAANYHLRYAGANGTFEDGPSDDLLVPLTVELTDLARVNLRIDPLFAALAPGNYRLTLVGTGESDSLRDLDGNPLGARFGPGSGEDLLHSFSVALGLAGGVDRYALPLAAGQEVTITTETPSSAATELANDLDPRLIVFRQNGSILAVDDNSSADGKNASLSFTAQTSGSYQVLVASASGWGEYLLHIQPSQPPAEVLDRQLFYDNSAFDQFTAGPSAADDLALASDLAALRPGQMAEAANISSYIQGITGIAIDVDHLADAENLSLADIEFRAGNDNDPANWPLAPAPTGLEVRPLGGTPSVERIYLTWESGAIVGRWLEITLRSTPATGLAADDRFYFGSSPADADASGRADAADFAATRANPRTFLSPAPITSDFDYNRDRLVNATDLLMVRDFTSGISQGLLLIEPPAAFSPGKTSSPAAKLDSPEAELLLLDQAVSEEADWLS